MMLHEVPTECRFILENKSLRDTFMKGWRELKKSGRDALANDLREYREQGLTGEESLLKLLRSLQCNTRDGGRGPWAAF